MLWLHNGKTSKKPLFFPEGGVDRRPPPETEETNYIEPEPESVHQPRAQSPDPPHTDNQDRNQVISKEQMCKEYFHNTIVHIWIESICTLLPVLLWVCEKYY